MKNQMRRKSNGVVQQNRKFYAFFFLSVLIVYLMNVSMIKGTELDNTDSNSEPQENITLIYNDINASGFPLIG